MQQNLALFLEKVQRKHKEHSVYLEKFEGNSVKRSETITQFEQKVSLKTRIGYVLKNTIFVASLHYHSGLKYLPSECA
jgi:hypothetical protein